MRPDPLAGAATASGHASPLLRPIGSRSGASRPDARIRLFCLPHVGGGASVYQTWRSGLPPEIDAWAVQPPGREDRLLEPAVKRMDVLIELLVEAVLPHLDRPFALFGHSLGARTAWALACTLFERHGLAPAHLFVSAARAPRFERLRGTRMHELPDGELRQRLRRMGGTPDAVLDDPDLMALLLPAIRADYTLLETDGFTATKPLSNPITALSGADDHDVHAEHVQAWSELTTGPFAMRTFPGGHFFIRDARDKVLATVAADLNLTM